MKNEEDHKKKFSWFWRWFLNNKAVAALLIILLILLIIFLFTKVSYLFEPVWQFLGIVGLPVILAGILYYILNPVVDWLERKKIPRVWSIIGLFIVVIGLIVWGIVILVPMIQSQTLSFAKNWPHYWAILTDKVNEFLSSPLFEQFRKPIDEASNELFQSITNIIKNVSTNTFQGLGNVVGVVANVFIAIVTMPFVLFFLLKDGKELPDYFIRFLPTKIRKPTMNVLSDMNRQVSQYVRGQLTVAFAVGVMFMIGFSVIGLDYSITLGIMAGFLNLIPYLGSFIAMIPALILGLVAGPAMLIKIIIVFAIEQTIEGRVVSPLVLGSQLDIHPITIIFVLLTAGKIFGIVGVILGIPGYAAIKVLVTHVFNWYRTVSGLFEEEENESEIAEKPATED